AAHYTHQHETEDKAKEECIEELHLNRQLVDGIDLNHILPENDTNLNILLACVWKKEGLQDDTGDINWRNLEKSFLKIVRENLKIKPKLESVISAGVEAKAIKACNKQNIIGKNDVGFSDADYADWKFISGEISTQIDVFRVSPTLLLRRPAVIESSPNSQKKPSYGYRPAAS
ncbi:hypothetical protein ILUMI_12734, partial [Ignelater luminosus]